MSKIYFKSTRPQPENSAEDEQNAVQEESVLKEVTAEAAEETAASDAAVAQASPQREKSGEKSAAPRKRQTAKPKASSEAAKTVTADEQPAKVGEEKSYSDVDRKATSSTAFDLTEDEQSSESATAGDTSFRFKQGEGFNKEKIVRYFKRHPKKQINSKVERFSPELDKGLTQKQVEKRFTQFLFNDTNKKYSKSYTSIIVGNVCTFFNLLCLCAFIALLLAGTQGWTNYLVIIITSANIIIGVIQEIRSKISIDKLSIMASATCKVVRDGEVVEIPSAEIVLDDIIILELGNQVPADCILAEGQVEVNESLLTGESIAIKKGPGDILYAGSFIASGSGKFRVEKVGRETYLEKLTAKAKKYRRPNSELMNSTKLIIKAVAFLIVPIAIGMFFVTYNAAFDASTSSAFDYIFSMLNIPHFIMVFKIKVCKTC